MSSSIFFFARILGVTGIQFFRFQSGQKIQTTIDWKRRIVHSKKKPVVLLTAEGPLATIVTNYLRGAYPHLVVIQEPRETKARIIMRRIRLIGLASTAGQVAATLLARLVARRSSRRISQICDRYRLDRRPILAAKTHHVTSVNCEDTRDLLADLNPSVVVVYGTRIIGPDTLQSVHAPFINYHAGINPAYRGQAPAYWALAKGQPELAGVTIHLVDQGVDTGSILYQEAVRFSDADNITTYDFVQMAAALPMLERAIEDALNNTLVIRNVNLPSRLWFPPTLWQYLWNGLVKSVW